MTLANQSLSQIDGQNDRNDAARAVLANAANLVALRIGAPDALRLAPWFEPDVAWLDLCRQPDFEAIVRVLDRGRPVPAEPVRLPRPAWRTRRQTDGG